MISWLSAGHCRGATWIAMKFHCLRQAGREEIADRVTDKRRAEFEGAAQPFLPAGQRDPFSPRGEKA